MVGKRAPTAERFLEKFKQGNPDDCWEWQANTNGVGYGLIWSLERRRKLLAHRYSYEHFTGKQLRSFDVVRHRCDNPSCVNPAHLVAGTQKQNMEDAAKKGRIGNTRLTAAEVISLLKDYVDGVPRKDLCKRYGIRESSLSDYTDGKSWTHLHGKHGCPTLEKLKAAKRTTPVTEETVREVWRLHFEGRNAAEIAEEVSQSRNSIDGIVLGKTWRHLLGAPSIEALRTGGVHRGFNQFSRGGDTRDLHPNTKIPSSEIPSILTRIEMGETLEAIGRTYGVKKAAIWHIKRKHTPD